MQTIRIPYRTDEAGAKLIASIRRIQSAAIRTAYANCVDSAGLKNPEKDVRELVKRRFSHLGVVDSWALHCATRVGIQKRKLVPDGMIFGGKANLTRRQKGLISNEEWRNKRLQPFVSYGDRQKRFGNQNVQLLSDGEVLLKIGRKPEGRSGKTVTDQARMRLVSMTGNAGEIVRQLAAICASPEEKSRTNVSYSIGSKFISITFDPADLPIHPERRKPVRAVAGRAIGIDLNPEYIGVSVVENRGDVTDLRQTELKDHFIVRTVTPGTTSAETVREMLAAICDRTIRLARKWGVGAICLENGLGKLRSGGYSRDTNRKNNYWTRTILVQMLTRKAQLAGIEIVQVWSGYSTTIGNLAFDAPDSAAAGAEIARRALARRAGIKDVLPLLDGGWLASRRKDLPLPAESGSWRDVHQAVKAAEKKIGYRRPHPEIQSPDPDGRVACFASTGHAVSRLGQRRRPGMLFRPVPIKARADSPENRVTQRKDVALLIVSTRKSG